MFKAEITKLFDLMMSKDVGAYSEYRVQLIIKYGYKLFREIQDEALDHASTFEAMAWEN